MSAGSHSPAALEVCELCAGYQMMPRAINDINFIVQPGESVAILGPNGAGKSTLLLALAGLVPHDKGEVRVHGHDCQHMNVQVGLVPQRNAIDSSFPVTVEEVVMMGCARASRWLPWWPKQARRRASEVLEMLNLKDLARRPFSALSGGQQQRIFIARALAQEADILLLDEPFSGVDVAAASEISATLRFLHNQGLTLLMTTHDMVRAARDFKRILLVRRTILADGAPQEVLSAEHLFAAYGKTENVFMRSRDGRIIIGTGY